ncbi:MAG: class I SAM-dependent methyltransferase [Myxococcales bacterium]|nr:class I SAM-dependent methyltransferase [Myxococcales bacterium]
MNPIARLYDRWLLPPLTHWACSARPITRQRQKVVPLAHGQVLEIGVGSGLNLPHYDPARVQRLWGLDPSHGMLGRARRLAARLSLPVEWLPLSAAGVPLPDASVDTVVMTYTLCTVPDPAVVLAEVRRVLRPEGRLLFSEHGLDPDAAVARWQRRLEPLWRPCAGGCHLTRDAEALLQASGFAVEAARVNLPGLAVLRHQVWGVARPVPR